MNDFNEILLPIMVFAVIGVLIKLALSIKPTSLSVSILDDKLTIKNDNFRNELYKANGIKLIIIKAGNIYDIQSIRSMLTKSYN